jgi:S1-C subfamily serine protease
VAAVIFIAVLSNLFGCTSVPKHYLTRQSFVKIEADIEGKHCIEDGLCQHINFKSSASGSIIANKRMTYILTAGHVCDLEGIAEEINASKVLIKFVVEDANGIKHPGTIYKLDVDNDICLMKVIRLNLPAIKLRSSGPRLYENLYNLAAPTGFAGKNYVPLLEGYYSGFNAYRMIFAIPAVGGSSGSPVFDSNGRMVGMIVAVHRRFPFISFSPHYNAIKNMINNIKH